MLWAQLSTLFQEMGRGKTKKHSIAVSCVKLRLLIMQLDRVQMKSSSLHRLL